MTTNIKVETITPVMAKKWLETMVSNRPVSDSKALEYAIEMEEGKWVLNGETIKFNGNGALFDGQHRLQACILAEKPFKSYVVRGIEDKMAFATVDVGKLRSGGDIFSLAGYKDRNNAAACAMWLYLYKNGGLRLGTGGPTRRYTQTEMEKSLLLQKIGKMKVRATLVTKEALLEFSMPLKKKIAEALLFVVNCKPGKVVSKSALAAAYILFSEKNESQAQEFCRDLCSGASLDQQDAVLILRERLMANQSSTSKLGRGEIFFLLLKAWNKRRSGEKVKTLKIARGEDFPKVQ
jgi:hypothetical protein